MILANRIRTIRIEKGLTQSEVADRCNISPSAYSQIERQAINCKFITLLKIAKALDVSITYLVDIEDELKNEK